MIGIEFTMKNGERDYYDPIDFPEDFKETETHYVLHNGSYEYEIAKSEVESIRYYELCPICGSEIYEDGCRNWHNI